MPVLQSAAHQPFPSSRCRCFSASSSSSDGVLDTLQSAVHGNTSTAIGGANPVCHNPTTVAVQAPVVAMLGADHQ
jgi:hypothetical protein